MKIKKGDTIHVITGKDRGKQGAVLRVLAVSDQVIVKGINILKRHTKARREGTKGERVEKEFPIHISNVMLLCPHTNKPTRIGYQMEGGEKVRVSKRSGKVI